MRRLLAMLCGVIGLIGLSAGAARAEPASCAVGAAALDLLLPGPEGEPPIISPHPVKMFGVTAGKRFSTAEAVVSQDLADAWARSAPTNLLETCPQLKSRLPAGWRYATDAEAARLDRPMIQLLGAPVVRGDEALMFVGYLCAGLCGGYQLRVWRRSGGVWRDVGVAALAMS